MCSVGNGHLSHVPNRMREWWHPIVWWPHFLGMILELFDSFVALPVQTITATRGKRVERTGMSYLQLLHFHPPADVVARMSHNLLNDVHPNGLLKYNTSPS